MSITSTLKTLAGKAAPFLGSLIGGQFGENAGKVLGNFLLGDENASEKDIAKALTLLTPEQEIKLKEIDSSYKLKMAELGLDESRIAAMDRESARNKEIQTGDKMPAILAILLTLGFFGLLVALTFFPIQEVALSTIQIMLGSLGTAWIAAMSYYFGSSSGSRVKTFMMTK